MKLKYYTSANTLGGQLNIGDITPLDNITGHNDVGFLINTSNGLIQGVQNITYAADGVSYVTSSNFYNRYIKSGSFFKIEPNTSSRDGSYFEIKDKNDAIINSGTEQILDTSDNVVAEYSKIQIFYDYLYY